MELKKDGILFINFLYRVASLIAFVTDYQWQVLPVKSGIFNWNNGVTERVVLILTNGLRDDFLEEGETPFLRGIAESNGTFARVAIDEIVTVEGSLRTLLTGSPWHGSLLPWNHPVKYRTILDYISCKCVIGHLPLSNPLDCQQSGENQTEVFERFLRTAPTDCLHVLTFDFGGSSERDYLRMLRELDGMVRKASGSWTNTTWILTSSRGWSPSRRNGRVDAPLLTWGKGILPKRMLRTLRLADVSGLVSTLLGRSFPAGSLAAVPTYLISASRNDKFHMTLYNFEHLEKSLGNVAEEDEFEVRNLSGIIDEGNTMSLRLSIFNFLEMVHGLRMTRMKIFTIVAVICFLFWSVVFVVAVSRGSLTVDLASCVVVFNVIGVVGVVVYLKPGILHVAAMVLLTPATLLSLSDVTKSFRSDGHRVYFLSLALFVFCTGFFMIGNHATIILLMIAFGLWPVLSRVTHRMNRKILLSWFASAVVLVVLSFFDVIGREPTPGVTILSGVFHVGLFHLAYHSFKHRVDRQGWVITVTALASTYHVYFCHLWGFTVSTCFLSWAFLSYSLFATFALRGTLLERQLKFHLLLLIPMQLLSNRHESLFHVSLALHMFSWVFIEYVSVEKSVLLYNPSIFTLDRPVKFPPDNLQLKHYRQVFFFLTYVYLSFFAAGNLPTIYTYDYASLKPFCHLYPLILLPLKLILPFASVVYTFLILHFTQPTDPATAFILSIHFSDVIATSLLSYAYIFTDVVNVNASHYIILQTATASVTALYLLLKHASFRQKI